MTSIPRVSAADVFPDLSEELDRRIAHSEQRLKYWVLAGIATNLLVAIFAAVPTIFYIGQISRDINSAMTEQKVYAVDSKSNDQWMRDRMIWEAKIEALLASRGQRMDSLEKKTGTLDGVNSH